MFHLSGTCTQAVENFSDKFNLALRNRRQKLQKRVSAFE